MDGGGKEGGGQGLGRGTTNDVRTDRWMDDRMALLYVLEMSTAKVVEMEGAARRLKEAQMSTYFYERLCWRCFCES